MAREGLAWLWKVPRLNVDISLSCNGESNLNYSISYLSAPRNTATNFLCHHGDVVKSSQAKVLSATNPLDHR